MAESNPSSLQQLSPIVEAFCAVRMKDVSAARSRPMTMFGGYDVPNLTMVRLRPWKIRLTVAGDVSALRTWEELFATHVSVSRGWLVAGANRRLLVRQVTGCQGHHAPDTLTPLASAGTQGVITPTPITPNPVAGA